jgi:hypothetical protein
MRRPLIYLAAAALGVFFGALLFHLAHIFWEK